MAPSPCIATICNTSPPLGGGAKKKIDLKKNETVSTRPPEKKSSSYLEIPGKKRRQDGKPAEKFLAPTDKYLAQRTSEYPNGQVLFLPVKTFT